MASKTEKKISAVVARGKTVKFEGRTVGPGGDVSLPESEVAYLLKQGYLVDSAASAVTIAPGPAFEAGEEGNPDGPAE